MEVPWGAGGCALPLLTWLLKPVTEGFSYCQKKRVTTQGPGGSWTQVNKVQARLGQGLEVLSPQADALDMALDAEPRCSIGRWSKTKLCDCGQWQPLSRSLPRLLTGGQIGVGYKDGNW